MASHSNGIGVVQYDLVGVGNAVGTTIRSTRALTNHLTVEGSLPLAWPVESFGRTRLSSPEAHLQYHWRVGSFRPYAGGGGGVPPRDTAPAARVRSKGPNAPVVLEVRLRRGQPGAPETLHRPSQRQRAFHR